MKKYASMIFTLITDRELRKNLSSGEYIRRLNILCSFGESRIIVRDNHVFSQQMLSLKELDMLSKNRIIANHELVFSSNIEKFKTLLSENKYKVKAIHMTHKDLSASSFDEINLLKLKGIKIGSSAHSKEEYDISIKKNADYILISPIFETKCKSSVRAISRDTLEYICSKSSRQDKEIIALGGIGYSRLVCKNQNYRYRLFSKFAIRSLFYESNDLENDLKKILEVSNCGC